MRVKTDQELANLLTTVKYIAVVGVSPKPDRPSHRVFRFLKDSGYTVYAINPSMAGQHIADTPVLSGLGDIVGPIDMVDIFRASEHLPAVMDDIIAAGVARAWTQLDVRHPDAENTALTAGLDLVVDRCPAIDIPRLQRLGLLANPVH